MSEGIVFDIKEFAVFDGPGIRTTAFLKGCPLRCQWCHNPEGLSPRPELMVSRAACIHCGACGRVCPSPERCTACGRCVPVCRGGLRRIVGRRWSAEALAGRLSKDADVYRDSGGGVTFSGGEPLMQWPFVAEVIRAMPGVHAAVETSGYASDEIFREAMALCDLILIDWKVSDPALHKRCTGVEQAAIRRHVQWLAQGGNAVYTAHAHHPRRERQRGPFRDGGLAGGKRPGAGARGRAALSARRRGQIRHGGPGIRPGIRRSPPAGVLHGGFRKKEHSLSEISMNDARRNDL